MTPQEFTKTLEQKRSQAFAQYDSDIYPNSDIVQKGKYVAEIFKRALEQYEDVFYKFLKCSSIEVVDNTGEIFNCAAIRLTPPAMELRFTGVESRTANFYIVTGTVLYDGHTYPVPMVTMSFSETPKTTHFDTIIQNVIDKAISINPF